MANPALEEAERKILVSRLMPARRAVRDAKRGASQEAEAAAHRKVDDVKQSLGERGPDDLVVRVAGEYQVFGT